MGSLRTRLGTFVAALRRRESMDREMQEEFAAHLALRADDLVRAGLAPDEAMRRARREFGNLTLTSERARESWGAGAIDRLTQDIRYAVRVLHRNPLVTAVAVLSLGFGIGATTTMFSVIDALDVRPLPYEDRDRLLWLAEVSPRDDRICPACAWTTSPATAAEWIAQAHTLAGSAVVADGAFSWQHDDVVESPAARRATPGFFSLLGTRPFLGRDFQSADTIAGAPRVVVVSHEFWRTRLGGDSSIVGETLRASLDGGDDPVLRPVTVIGVLPPGFTFAGRWAVWTPMRLSASQSHGSRVAVAVGRLKPGYSIDAATAELRLLSARIAATDSAAMAGWGAVARPLRDALTWTAGRGRFVLFSVTVLVLLIAVLNVAGLLLSRANARQAEFAMRSALGADRWRIVRQQLVEGCCIGLAGGIVGLLFAVPAMRFASRWFAMDSSGLGVRMDGRMLAFVIVVSLIAGAGTALMSGVRVAQGDLSTNLRERGATETKRAARTSAILITAQVAVALLIVASATLLSADFVALRYADLGFDPRGVYSTFLAAPRAQATAPMSWRAAAENVRDRVARIPGVVVASLEYRSAVHPGIVRPAAGNVAEAARRSPTLKAVDAGYFDAWRMHLAAGRWFATNDDVASPRVAVVNATAAALFWPGRSPIGQQVFLGDSPADGELVTVVGVTRDVERAEMVERHWPTVYRPLSQATVYHSSLALHLRVEATARATAVDAAQGAIRELTHQMGLSLRSEDERLSARFESRRYTAIVLDLFAAFGLLLAALGIYGSIAYAVTRRTREIGVRIALGADHRSVLLLIGRRGVRLALAGVALGAVGTLGVTRVLRSFVSATSATNPWVLAGACLLMVAVALLSAYLPARQALRVDAAVALRAD